MWKKRGKVQGELRRYVMEKRKEKILGLLGMKSAKVALECFK